jgi:N-methylhydantoinase B/oxoprolinase/acetone carboxylase alpha subunit
MVELDKVKYEVFYEKLDKAINEAKEVIRYLSAGMITREAGEVQEAFYLPDGQAAHISSGILMHILNVTRVIKYMHDNGYDGEGIGIHEGDQFINNDAYIGGMHCQDISVVQPVFYKNKLVGWVAGISHTSDVGAIESAGTCPSAKESIHDGLHLNVVKLVDRGVMRRDVFAMILRGVRDSTYVELDIRARMAGNERAIRRLTELIDDVGLEFFEAACQKLIDDAEMFARDRLMSIKPGTYRGRVFDDTPVLENGKLVEKLCVIEVEAEVTEKGDFLVRLPVVSQENGGFNNSYLPAIEATTFYITLPLALYDCRWNSGFNRAIRIVEVPDKSRLSASPNRSVNYAAIGIALVYGDALMDAMARALFVSGRYDDVTGAVAGVNSTGIGGLNQYGRMVVQSITSSVSPGGGALLDHDGHDANCTYFNPWTYLTDCESEEQGLPIIHLARYLRANSGGFGKFRGGCGMTNVTMIHDSPSVGITKWGSGGKIPLNQGLFGGYPGAASIYDMMPETNIFEVISKGGAIPFTDEDMPKLLKGEVQGGQNCAIELTLKSGSVWQSSSNSGGAGVGDPIERDPALIVKDLENKTVTLEVAQKVYAVAIDPVTLKVDNKETETLREERRKERLARGIPGGKYLQQLVELREKKRLPKFLLDYLDQTQKFCPSFGEELAREKKIAAQGIKPLGPVKVKSKLFALTPYVDVVEDEKGRKVEVCSKCGFGYCEAHDNFKLNCLVYDRSPDDYHPGKLAWDKEWCVLREFYCPSCGSQVEVETVPPGTPIMWNYELKV